MDKCANTAWAAALPLLFACAACDVYEPSARRSDENRDARDAGLGADVTDSAAADDAGEDDHASDEEHCGNGLIDPGERCDVAIARGRVGACPEGCSGRDACIEHVLAGRACMARCVEVKITRASDDDGCCPPEANASVDNDCAGHCGNGTVERGEQCDPPSACAKSDACRSDDPCQVAHYSGDPDRCTAACELRPIRACVSGDSCCPAGCTHQADPDCQPEDAGAPCTENCEPTTDPDPEPETDPKPGMEPDCQTQHSGGRCEACDCEMCQVATTACLTAPGEGGAEKCEAVIRCAAEARCTNLECLCGAQNTQRCRSWPAGPCVSEIRAAGGERDVYQLILSAATEDGPLARAVSVMSCRQQACRRACGL